MKRDSGRRWLIGALYVDSLAMGFDGYATWVRCSSRSAKFAVILLSVMALMLVGLAIWEQIQDLNRFRQRLEEQLRERGGS
jgi:hypothetical protein